MKFSARWLRVATTLASEKPEVQVASLFSLFLGPGKKNNSIKIATFF